jgi:uncharacterized NAD(P)/FAD-binding protein YdhS
MSDALRIAIVGLGPWGLCALERIVARAGARPAGARAVAIHVVEPSRPGTGIYDPALPDYLVMNNACGDITLSPSPPGLHAWAVARGYRWVEGACAIDPAGRPVQPEDFLPRRVMGEYLHAQYRRLADDLPAGVTVTHHAAAADDVVGAVDGRETVVLANGLRIDVDHVVLAPGHVANAPHRGGGGGGGGPGETPAMLAPYEALAQPGLRRPGTRVAINGQGLVATDVVIGLTQGAGGRFEPADDRGGLVYRASGREPTIHLYSRSGLPYRAKCTRASQVPQRTVPVTYRAEDLARMRSRGRERTDFRRDWLPVLLREMRARYHLQALHEAEGDAACAREAARLRAMHDAVDLDAALAGLAARFGAFDPMTLLAGESRAFDTSLATSCDYQAHVRERLVDESTATRRSGPLDAACETLRALRDDLRAVVEAGRLAPASHLDFFGEWRGAINRLVAGPPAWRLAQLVALIDAGVLHIPFGPAPSVEALGDGRVRIASRGLATPCVHEVDVLVRGHLEDPRLDGSRSPLVAALHRRGRLRPWTSGDLDVGSVDLTSDAHPVDADGRPQERLWLFGALTEGARFFTHYLPSPHRGMRAFDDLDRCAQALLA